jgi:hypothetical protein
MITSFSAAAYKWLEIQEMSLPFVIDSRPIAADYGLVQYSTPIGRVPRAGVKTKVKSFIRFADSTWIICRRVDHVPFHAEHWPTEKEEVDLCLLPEHLVLYNVLYILPGKRRCLTVGTYDVQYVFLKATSQK